MKRLLVTKGKDIEVDGKMQKSLDSLATIKAVIEEESKNDTQKQQEMLGALLEEDFVAGSFYLKLTSVLLL